MDTANKKPTLLRWLMIFSLIFAGEMIFSLPFHVARFFRPTLLHVFELSNTQLGDVFAFYGIAAMLSYFPGGIIADYFSARRLLTFSLSATALGGIFFAQIPQGRALTLLFGYWGLTTIFLFWAGMIKAVRQWGNSHQGQAFGLLEGGRGLVAALMSSIAVLVLAQALQNDIQQDIAAQTRGIKWVIYLYTLFTFIAAILVWVVIPEDKNRARTDLSLWSGVSKALSSLQVWLIAAIVVCAYCAYKAADNYGLYAVQVLSMGQVEAAAFMSWSAYLRPIAAIGAGLLADRFSASRVITWCFLVTAAVYLVLATLESSPVLAQLAMLNMSVSFVSVFALRAVYFAVLEDSKVKWQITGTAVGIISLIGFTPDIFFVSLAGRILDAAPGAEGFENYFMLMMIIALLGLLVSWFLHRINTAK